VREITHDEMLGIAAHIASDVVRQLKDQGLVHDDRPLLTLDQAARRLGVSDRVMGDLTRGKPAQDGKPGQPAVIATVKVIPQGHKGVMVEPAELDRYIEQQRRVWLSDRS
jgi:hypothetical protein